MTLSNRQTARLIGAFRREHPEVTEKDYLITYEELPISRGVRILYIRRDEAHSRYYLVGTGKGQGAR